MKNTEPSYPDISEILTQKASGRRRRATLSFGQKLALLDQLRDRVEPFVQARKARKEGESYVGVLPGKITAHLTAQFGNTWMPKGDGCLFSFEEYNAILSSTGLAGLPSPSFGHATVFQALPRRADQPGE
jgi:hypothetical protein